MKYAVVLLILLLGCSQSGMKSGNYGEDLLAYAPASSDLVFYMNAKDIRNSEIAKNEIEEHSERLFKEGKEQYKEFVELTGLDPEKDIHAFLVAGDSDEMEDKQSGVFIAQGAFEEAKIISYMKEKIKEEAEKNNHVAKIDDVMIANKKVYRISGKNEIDKEDKDMAISFIDKNIVLISSGKAIESVLTAQESVLDNKEMMAKIKLVNGHQMYGVMNTEQIKDKLKDTEKIGQYAAIIEDVSVAMNFDKEMTMSMVSNCNEADQAENLKKVIEGLISGVKMAVSQERELIDLMQEIYIDQDKKQIKMSLTIDQERLRKLKNYEPKFKQGI